MSVLDSNVNFLKAVAVTRAVAAGPRDSVAVGKRCHCDPSQDMRQSTLTAVTSSESSS